MTALRRIPAAAWTALFGALATLWLFYPGFVSFDTAHQWYQVRHGEYSDHHPPLMAFLWSLTEPLLPGPGAPFLFQVAIWWASLAVLATQLFQRTSSQILAVLLVGFAPPLFVLLTHVWKDVMLMAWLLAVAAILVVERNRPVRDRRLLVAAAIGLVGIAALRHNALAAVLPLTAYIAWRWRDGGRQPASCRRVAVGSMLLFSAITLLAQLPARHPQVERVQFWPTVALWDLAAVSIAENRVLIPESLQLRPLTPEMLATHFQPDVNVPLFMPSDLLKVSVVAPYSDEELAQLRSAWLALPLAHTRSWLAHRWRLARIQLGLPDPGLPTAQDLMADYTPFRDNPPLRIPALALREQALAGLRAISGTFWLAAWPWLLASLPMALLLWRRRRCSPQAMLGLTLLTSGWAYALSLTVLAASAELRYLSVTLTTIAAAALIVFAPSTDACGIDRTTDRPPVDSSGTGG